MTIYQGISAANSIVTKNDQARTTEPEFGFFLRQRIALRRTEAGSTAAQRVALQRNHVLARRRAFVHKS
jgi:hypothetical protein